MNKGKVIQVLSSVVDVEFKNSLPAINNALTIKIDKEFDNRNPLLDVSE